MQQPANAKKILNFSIFGWCLFDFTNSIPAVVGGIYFSKWFIEDVKAGSIAYNILFFLAALIVMATGRWIGERIDSIGYKIWIKISALLCFFSMLLLFIGSQILSRSYLVALSFLLFLVFLFSYQVGRICHNVYLRTIVPQDIQSKISGFGAASNWAGSLVGILVTIPLVLTFPKELAREMTFLEAAILYGIFTLISLRLMFRSTEARSYRIIENNKSTFTFKHFFVYFRMPLILYLLLFDVMATVEKNLPPYLSSVFKMSDDKQSIGFLLILISAMVGGIAASKFVSERNSGSWIKLSAILLGASIFLITIRSNTALWAAFVVAGITYGILESAMRINFMNRFPNNESGKNFGTYAAVERASGVIGPLIWIIPFSIIGNGSRAFVDGMQLMAVLCLLAVALCIFSKDSSTNN